MARPDFLAPHGWDSAIRKQIKVVEDFAAWEICLFSDYLRDLKHYGPDRVNLACIVTDHKSRRTLPGTPAAAVSPTSSASPWLTRPSFSVSIETFSYCADGITNRLITDLAPVLDAHQTTIDISGAYFHGTPLPPAEGGRLLYAAVLM